MPRCAPLPLPQVPSPSPLDTLDHAFSMLPSHHSPSSWECRPITTCPFLPPRRDPTPTFNLTEVPAATERPLGHGKERVAWRKARSPQTYGSPLRRPRFPPPPLRPLRPLRPLPPLASLLRTGSSPAASANHVAGTLILCYHRPELGSAARFSLTTAAPSDT